ncbi:cation channel sperm-associated auxiliary subunit TMEM249 [Gopherus flavomarginatus]|uniref:cation channel sperm-associated auxiliary subunit TMEM249 n=1 Tax=Gopherus flavomarginatus TaxID=286002 RepID=UPI0021CBC4B9|nr:cation channel sperm-associated auxiliary subunit TMEM249 [Gopherus flavomarginatus]
MLRGAFVLWNLCFFDVERSLARRLQQNTHYPFQVQQPNVFVMEYYKDTLWKGTLIFLICVLGGVFYFKSEKVFQDYSGFFVYGTLVGFWLLLSSMHKRHLVINHVQGCYQIYIKRRLWEEGPLHQIYVRLTAQTDGTAPARGESPPFPHRTLAPHWLPLACPAAYGKCFYSLIINGHGLEVLVLANLSDKYEHMEFLGRRIARKLKLNYFDYLDVSTRHVIRHRPPLEQEEELQVWGGAVPQ